MTEADWLACQEPQKMLAWLRTTGRLSERKARLFAVACCGRIGHLLTDERSKRAVEVAERFADGGANREELGTAREQAQTAHRDALVAVRAGNPSLCLSASWTAYRVARSQAGHGARDAIDFCPFAVSGVPRHAANQAHIMELSKQADLVRDIFGPLLFRPLSAINVSILSWNGGIIERLAQAAYNERVMPQGMLDTTRLAVLADALEEAGANNDEILEHLRQPGQVHVRGCWAADALLGKT
jgi:hypothetical protein